MNGKSILYDQQDNYIPGGDPQTALVEILSLFFINTNLQNGVNINISFHWCNRQNFFEVMSMMYKITATWIILPGTYMPAITTTHYNSILVQIQLVIDCHKISCLKPPTKNPWHTYNDTVTCITSWVRFPIAQCKPFFYKFSKLEQEVFLKSFSADNLFSGFDFSGPFTIISLLLRCSLRVGENWSTCRKAIWPPASKIY